MSVREERYFANYFDYISKRFISSIFYYRVFRKIYPHTPWYTPGAIKEVQELLPRNAKVFEWGVGASSIWYAKRVDEYIGIEDNASWYSNVSKGLDSEAKRVILCSNPEEYIDYIKKFPDNYFDCISIDGRNRIACLKNAVKKLSDSGFIVFDDSQRPKYRAKGEIVACWDANVHDFGVLQTTIYKKNAN